MGLIPLVLVVAGGWWFVHHQHDVKVRRQIEHAAYVRNHECAARDHFFDHEDRHEYTVYDCKNPERSVTIRDNEIQP